MKYFKHMFAWPGTLVAMALFSMLWLDVPGRIEGKFFPVIAKINISKTEAANLVSIRLWGDYVILREGCSFQRTEWIFTGTSNNHSVPVVYEDGTKDLTKGWHEFGPWLLMLTRQQFRNNTIGEAVHTCPWRPWSTRTVFYPT